MLKYLFLCHYFELYNPVDLPLQSSCIWMLDESFPVFSSVVFGVDWPICHLYATFQNNTS